MQTQIQTNRKENLIFYRRDNRSQPLTANSKPQMQQRNYNVDWARECVCVCETCGTISIISNEDAVLRSVLCDSVR